MLDALDIGFAIKNQRTKLGLTQAQVADASGVSKRCLWALELGRNPGVQFNKLCAVLMALNLDLSVIDADMSACRVESAEAPEVDRTETSDRPLDSTTDATLDIDALAILTKEAKWQPQR